MDPLTHAALGIVAASVCASRKTPLRHAALAGLAAAWLPDLDILLRAPGDPLAAFRWHRHFTHSVAFSPVIALVAATLARALLRRKTDWRALLFPAWAGAMSHLLNDAGTSYGTLLAWPFSAVRTSWDILPIVDPLALTLPLAVLAGIALTRRSRTAAWIGLGWMAVYATLGATQHARARLALDAHLREAGVRADSVYVTPAPLSLVLWRGVVEADGQLRAFAIRPGLGAVKLWRGDSAPAAKPGRDGVPPPGTPAGDAARDLFAFAQGRMSRVALPDGTIRLGDARFSRLPHTILPMWGVDLDPAAPEKPATAAIRTGVSAGEFRTFLGLLFDDGDAPPGAVISRSRPAPPT